MKTKYALGFIFDSSLSSVLLIQKNRPTWQRGKLNGVGGHVEENEKPVLTFAREVLEETNIVLNKKDIQHIGSMEGSDWYNYVFTTIYTGKKEHSRTMTDEKIVWVKVDKLPKKVISNLTWLIPLARDYVTSTEGDLKKIKVVYE